MSASPELNLSQLELVSTLRVAPLNGPPSSEDYNDGEQEKLVDLTTLVLFLNNTLIPMLNTLIPSAASGIDGSGVYGDISSQETLFYNAQTGLSMSVADSLRFVYGMAQTISTTLSNLGVQVSQLNARLSSTNQNDISLALQGFTSNLNLQLAQIQALQNAVSSLQTIVGASMLSTQTTSSIAPGATETVAIEWSIPFSSNSYVVSYGIEDPSGFLQVTGFVYSGTGTGILVHVLNTDTTAAHTGTVNAIAQTNSLTS